MNKPLLFLYCLTVAASCRNTGSHPNPTVTMDSVISDKIAAPPAITNLDTSLVALKTFQTLSLEDAISQVWKFDDADKTHWNKIFWDTVTDTRQYPELALFHDHSALLNPRCGLKTGTWNLDKENGEMSDPDGLNFISL